MLNSLKVSRNERNNKNATNAKAVNISSLRSLRYPWRSPDDRDKVCVKQLLIRFLEKLFLKNAFCENYFINQNCYL